MRTWLRLLPLIVLSLLVLTAEAMAKQVAFVVGNARYADLPPLKNPKRDAATMADRLRDLGFEVIEVLDADTFTLDRNAKRFIGEARGADLALVYFAGHGIQLFDRNVLLASDADPGRASSLADLGIDLTDLMRKVREAGPVRSAYLIDACRDNALSFDDTVALLRRLQPGGPSSGANSTAAKPSRGLARMDLSDVSGSGSGAGETLLYFAAQPGRVSFDGEGQNSYFVEGLKEALGEANRPLAQVFQQASAYVRTVTRGEQVPQVVSDWTGDVVLGKTETAKVRYLNSSGEGGRDLTDAELKRVGEAQRAFSRLSGTFIVQESQAFTDSWRAAPQGEQTKARALGMVNGFAIDYDLDRDGREETIAAYVRQVNVVFELVDDGVSTQAAPCFDEETQEIEAVDMALRDLDGDRKPEIFLHLLAKDDAWGTFCIVRYRGNTGLADARRGPDAMGYDDSIFQVLLKETVMSVQVGADNTIQSCSGSNCHTRSRWRFDGERFTMTEDESEPPQGARAKPFRDEEERKRLGAVNEPAPAAGTAAAADRAEDLAMARPAGEPVRSAGVTVESRIADYITSVYLPDGRDGVIATRFTDIVAYYGSKKTRDQVLADKRKYYSLWTTRRYEMVPGTLSVTDKGGGKYDVSFEYTFLAASATKRSEGRGSTQLWLEADGDGFVVSHETGAVISRK